MKKSMVVVNAAALFLFVGMIAPARAAQGQEDNPQAEHQEAPHDHGTKQDQHAQEKQQHAQQKQQEQAQKDQQKAQKEEQQRQEHQEKAQQKQAQEQQKQQQKQAHEQQQQQRQAKEQQHNHEHNQQAANHGHPDHNAHPNGHMEAQNRGQRIPENRFREHFGRDHHFRVQHVTVVEGHPRFQYSGYWFQLVEPWPVAWSYDDDCYIDYVDDEYWLFDPLHPGMQIEVIVVE